MAREQRVPLDPLDQPLSRRDFLTYLTELAGEQTRVGNDRSATATEGVMMKLADVWCRKPEPERPDETTDHGTSEGA
jgi:hypothetical protein